MAFISLPMWLTYASLILAGAGLASHQLLWRRGEWDRHAWKIVLVLLAATFMALLCLVHQSYELLDAIEVVFVLECAYFLPLFASIAIYRMFFHHLRRFPGPLWARLSMFWRLKRLVYNKQENFRLVARLHDEHGEFVRLGGVHTSA